MFSPIQLLAHIQSSQRLLASLLTPWFLSFGAADHHAAVGGPVPAPDAHNWAVAEVFSNASGTVQFIEWLNPDADEDLLAGEGFTTASGRSFTFPSNLPHPNTANRRFLLATAAFAALPGAPTPDYIMPAGTLRITGDTINYSGGDNFTFGALPTNGVSSRLRSGATQVNSPQNFAGQTGSVQAGTLASFTTFGIGCAPAGGLPMTVTGTPPVLGGTFTVTFTQRPSPVVLAHMGFSTTVGTGIVGTPALPWELSALGMPGCLARVSADLGTFFLINGVLSLPIPNLPQFAGLPLHIQGVAEAPGTNALGVVISNAGTGIVGF